jgi:hypothetical protein
MLCHGTARLEHNISTRHGPRSNIVQLGGAVIFLPLALILETPCTVPALGRKQE